MTDNPFLKRYKTIDSSELLDIIDFPNDFQPLAVEAARLEIEIRQLSLEQLADAKAKQDLRQKAKTEKQQTNQNFENKVKSVGLSLVNTFNPIQTGALDTEKKIKLIVIFLFGLFLYQFYKEFSLLTFVFTDSLADWDFSTLLYLMPFFLLPTAGLLLWQKKRLGWMLTMIFASYSAVGAIPLLIMGLNREPSGVPAFDNIFPATSPIYYIGTFLIFGGLAWALCKENIRVVYQIDKQRIFVAIGIGIGLILLMTFL